MKTLVKNKQSNSSSHAFMSVCYADHLLRPLFPSDRRHVEQAQTRFLIQLTGGPKQYDSYDERMNLAMIHRLLPIKEVHAIRWIELMTMTIEETISDSGAATRLIERLRIGALQCSPDFVMLIRIG